MRVVLPCSSSVPSTSKVLAGYPQSLITLPPSTPLKPQQPEGEGEGEAARCFFRPLFETLCAWWNSRVLPAPARRRQRRSPCVRAPRCLWLCRGWAVAPLARPEGKPPSREPSSTFTTLVVDNPGPPLRPTPRVQGYRRQMWAQGHACKCHLQTCVPVGHLAHSFLCKVG